MAFLQMIRTNDKIRDRKTKRIIKTSARRYRDVETGRIYSRYQRDKIIKKAAASPSYNDVTLSNRYKSLLSDYIAKKAQTGEAVSIRKAQLSPEFTGILKDLKKGDKLRKAGKKQEAQEYLLRALNKTTRRDNIAPEVIVGESPK